MSGNPRISVLMSMKNAVPYLEHAVSSILRQTFTDWEFVILDNRSTDSSREFVERLARTDPRVIFIRNESDLGHCGGLNRGLAVCRGEWIARMDADDIAMPNRLERQLAFVQGNPDVATASCMAFYINPHGERVGKTIRELTTREEFHQFHRDGLALGILHPGAFIRRDLLVKLGGYRHQYSPAHDIDLWCRIADRHLILNQPEYLLEYRVHGESLSAKDYHYGRLKNIWARDSMIARRAGRPEPAWEEFLSSRQNARLWTRLNRWRKLNAKRLYRQAALNRITARRFRSVGEMFAAVLLQPEYALPRFRGQLLR